MRTTIAVLIALTVTVFSASAEDKFCVIEKKPQAKGPVGAVVETAGVFAGRIASAVEISMTGERRITVENETGECKVFPFCATTKVADQAFNAVTFNKLQKGECVKVKYSEDNGIMKAEEVVVGKELAGSTKAAPAK